MIGYGVKLFTATVAAVVCCNLTDYGYFGFYGLGYSIDNVSGLECTSCLTAYRVGEVSGTAL